jgi:hypothetical protein
MATLANLFMKQKEDFLLRREFKSANVRTLDEATRDALSDEATQYHGSDTVDDDDDDN